MTVTKSVDDTTPEPDQVFTYTVTVSNSAASDRQRRVRRRRCRRGAHPGVVVDTATISGGGVYNAGARTITWTIGGPVAPGTFVTRTYDAKLAASAGLTAAPKVNTVTVESYHSLSGGGRTYTQRPAVRRPSRRPSRASRRARRPSPPVRRSSGGRSPGA